MLIVAIETSTVAVSVALADADGLVARFDAPRSRRHAETIVPALGALLDLSGYTRADITHLSVDVGPGMFTGLRVGVTTAITLAFALDVPVIPVGSLELLAWRAAFDGTVIGPVAAVLDARRKECFVELFEVGPGAAVSHGEPCALAPAEAAQVARIGGCVALVGDGPSAYPEAFVGLRVLAPFRPDAATAALVALGRIHEAVAPDSVALRYVREPDAEIPKDLR